MRIKESYKFGLRMLHSKGSWICVMIFALAFNCVFQTIHIFLDLYQEMSAPATLICSISTIDKQMLDKTSAISGIEYLSQYYETTLTVSWGEYSQDVTVLGMEWEYLTAVYGSIIAVPMQGAMPYVLIESTVLSEMKNKKKEKLPATEQDYLLQTLQFGQEVTKDGRICGIIPVEQTVSEDNVAGNGIPFVYTTLEGYKNLVGTIQGTENLTGKMYMLQVGSSHKIDYIMEELTQLGFQVKLGESEEANVLKWTQDKEDGWKYIYMSFIALLCGSVACYYQGELWKKNHEDMRSFINIYDHSGRGLKRIYGSRWAWMLILGIVGGSLVYTINTF